MPGMSALLVAGILAGSTGLALVAGAIGAACALVAWRLWRAAAPTSGPAPAPPRAERVPAPTPPATAPPPERYDVPSPLWSGTGDGRDTRL